MFNNSDHCRSKIFFQTNETRNYRFRYAIRWLRHGYKTEGLLSLWRGNTATLARIVPYSAINFMSFEQYKKLFRVEEPGRPGYYRCGPALVWCQQFRLKFFQVPGGQRCWVHRPTHHLSLGPCQGRHGRH